MDLHIKRVGARSFSEGCTQSLKRGPEALASGSRREWSSSFSDSKCLPPAPPRRNLGDKPGGEKMIQMCSTCGLAWVGSSGDVGEEEGKEEGR